MGVLILAPASLRQGRRLGLASNIVSHLFECAEWFGGIRPEYGRLCASQRQSRVRGERVSEARFCWTDVGEQCGVCLPYSAGR